MEDEIWRRDEIDSPCVKVCMIHPESRICLGCNRTADEIARWSRMSDAERARIMAELPGRNPGPRRRGGGARARRAARRDGQG
ncbi:MAG: DUF1289 domain-containing protein [Paracoccaceae bacterium]|nr:DUF1289 domain-containing protein [Paracoccaceae bacterium]